jgi:hypothetical protein
MIDISPDMKLRLPVELRRGVENAAKANRRSLNAEITARLEASFKDDFGVPDFVSGNRIDALSVELETLRAEVRALTAIVNAMQQSKS